MNQSGTAGGADEASVSAKRGEVNLDAIARERETPARTSVRIASRNGGPAAIMPPPKRTMSGSMVCIRFTAPTARQRAVFAHQSAHEGVAHLGGLGDGPAGQPAFVPRGAGASIPV